MHQQVRLLDYISVQLSNYLFVCLSILLIIISKLHRLIFSAYIYNFSPTYEVLRSGLGGGGWAAFVYVPQLNFAGAGEVVTCPAGVEYLADPQDCRAFHHCTSLNGPQSKVRSQG